jgi:hypothetical protein
MIFRDNPHNVQRSLLLRFGFRSVFLLADDVFPGFVFAVIALETAALDTPNKMAPLFTDAEAKRAPTTCCL